MKVTCSFAPALPRLLTGSEPPSIQREDWMTKPMKREGLTRTQQEAEEDRKQVWRGDRVFGAVRMGPGKSETLEGVVVWLRLR